MTKVKMKAKPATPRGALLESVGHWVADAIAEKGGEDVAAFVNGRFNHAKQAFEIELRLGQHFYYVDVSPGCGVLSPEPWDM